MHAYGLPKGEVEFAVMQVEQAEGLRQIMLDIIPKKVYNHLWYYSCKNRQFCVICTMKIK